MLFLILFLFLRISLRENINDCITKISSSNNVLDIVFNNLFLHIKTEILNNKIRHNNNP